jgi:putative hydrolase of the HAD superfamily
VNSKSTFKGSDAVLFDLGGVVVDVDKEKSRIAWERVTGLMPSTFDGVFFESGIKPAMDRGLLSTDEALEQIATDFGIALDVHQLASVWNAMIAIRRDVVELIRSIAKYTHVGVVSNTDPIHAAYIESDPSLGEAVGCWTYSFEAGSLKPDLEIYQLALCRMGLCESNVFFIDDRAENVGAARDLGLDGTVYESVPVLRKDLERIGLHL